MGSWIRISEQLPDIERRVWFLVETPEYTDLSTGVKIPMIREVYEGYRFEDEHRGKGYSYSLLLENMEETFPVYGGETETFEWGEVTEIIAWMPMFVPDVDKEIA